MGRLLDDIVSDRQSFARQVHGAIEGHRLNGPGDTRLSSVLFGAAWPCMANVCKMAAQGTISPESATNAVSVLLEAGANPLLWDEASGNDPFGALVDYVLDANGFVPDLSDVASLLLFGRPLRAGSLSGPICQKRRTFRDGMEAGSGQGPQLKRPEENAGLSGCRTPGTEYPTGLCSIPTSTTLTDKETV